MNPSDASRQLGGHRAAGMLDQAASRCSDAATYQLQEPQRHGRDVGWVLAGDRGLTALEAVEVGDLRFRRTAIGDDPYLTDGTGQRPRPLVETIQRLVANGLLRQDTSEGVYRPGQLLSLTPQGESALREAHATTSRIAAALSHSDGPSSSDLGFGSAAVTVAEAVGNASRSYIPRGYDMHSSDDTYRHQEVLVSPMYLAGSSGAGDTGFAPVAHWPHRYLDEGPCQLVVTSPDQRIRIGWFGDDFELWKISAGTDAVSAPRWTATFNHVTPAEMVAGLTTALAHDYVEADAFDGNGRFLAKPSLYWADAVQPLIDAGWRRPAGERGTVEIVAPDGQAGALIDNRLSGWNDETIILWAGPPGWGTRAEAVFTTRTPSHLIAATAAIMANAAPVIRERHQIDRRVEHLVTLTPVGQVTDPQVRRAPTPLDVRRTAVVQAVHRTTRAPRTAADLRVTAAQSRTVGVMKNQSSSFPPASATPPTNTSAPRRSP